MNLELCSIFDNKSHNVSGSGALIFLYSAVWTRGFEKLVFEILNVIETIEIPIIFSV